jgi:hypothetical protein
MKVVVYHDGYGCETGCCGHSVALGSSCDSRREGFNFEHWDERKETAREFAERLIEEKLGKDHGADLDWDNCEIVGDCNW